MIGRTLLGLAVLAVVGLSAHRETERVARALIAQASASRCLKPSGRPAALSFSQQLWLRLAKNSVGEQPSCSDTGKLLQAAAKPPALRVDT
jgi:hypothetical protein